MLDIEFRTLLVKIQSLMTVLIPSIALSFVSAYRLMGDGRDHAAYMYLFAKARDLNLQSLVAEIGIDFGFALIIKVLSLLPPNDALYIFLITFLGVSLKLLCLRRMAPDYWIAVLIYVAFFYTLHDYTQLRVSLAIAFFMLALTQWLTGGSTKSVLTVSAISLSIHYSLVLLALFAAVLVVSKIWFMVGVGVSLFGDQLLYPEKVKEFLNMGSRHVNRFAAYLIFVDDYRVLKFISPRKAFEYMSAALFLLYRSEISRRGWRMVEYSGWFFIAGVAIYFGFARYEVIGIRLSEMFMAFLPFLVSGLYALLPNRLARVYLGIAILMGFGRSASIMDFSVWDGARSLFTRFYSIY